jgi:hypothetical protein
MKVLEALADEIKRQKQIDALMKLKEQRERELKEIRLALRKVIYNK